MWTVKDYK